MFACLDLSAASLQPEVCILCSVSEKPPAQGHPSLKLRKETDTQETDGSYTDVSYLYEKFYICKYQNYVSSGTRRHVFK